eukprot:scaffold2753_cov65-Phaeocystis_antarctica.AAC.3
MQSTRTPRCRRRSRLPLRAARAARACSCAARPTSSAGCRASTGGNGSRATRRRHGAWRGGWREAGARSI